MKTATPTQQCWAAYLAALLSVLWRLWESTHFAGSQR